MSQHGFGIIGCGMIAEFHTRAINEIPGASVVGRVRAGSPANAEKIAGDGRGHVPDLRRPGHDAGPARAWTSSASARPAAPTWSRPCRPPGRASTWSSRSRWRSPCRGATRSSTPAMPPASGSARSSPRGSRRPTSGSRRPSTAGRFGRLTLGDTYVKWWRTQEYYDSGGWRGTWDLDGGGALMNQADPQRRPALLAHGRRRVDRRP